MKSYSLYTTDKKTHFSLYIITKGLSWNAQQTQKGLFIQKQHLLRLGKQGDIHHALDNTQHQSNDRQDDGQDGVFEASGKGGNDTDNKTQNSYHQQQLHESGTLLTDIAAIHLICQLDDTGEDKEQGEELEQGRTGIQNIERCVRTDQDIRDNKQNDTE